MEKAINENYTIEGWFCVTLWRGSFLFYFLANNKTQGRTSFHLLYFRTFQFIKQKFLEHEHSFQEQSIKTTTSASAIIRKKVLTCLTFHVVRSFLLVPRGWGRSVKWGSFLSHFKESCSTLTGGKRTFALSLQNFIVCYKTKTFPSFTNYVNTIKPAIYKNFCFSLSSFNIFLWDSRCWFYWIMKADEISFFTNFLELLVINVQLFSFILELALCECLRAQIQFTITRKCNCITCYHIFVNMIADVSRLHYK